MTVIGGSSERLDLPDKIFGNAIFIHDMRLPGMVHARVVRQPNRGAIIDAVD
jgi:CO/xanthine dehydrogenase Mo-binding subunit